MRARQRKRLLGRLEMLLWAAAIVLLGGYAAVYLDRTAFQAYQEWSFDRELAHAAAPSSSAPSSPAPPAAALASATRLKPGATIGRIEIPRLGVRAIVVESTSEECLRRAVGHIEGTALPGQPGNIGLAGHRDTFFRGLRRIRKGDVIRLRTLSGTLRYAVVSTHVVEPDDVDVLNASSRPTLTLVTCFPFQYIGAAPHRFIVRAREIGRPPATSRPPRGS